MGFKTPNTTEIANSVSTKANLARVAIEDFKEAMEDLKKEIEDGGYTANAAGAKSFAEAYGIEAGGANELGKSTDWGETMVDAYSAADALQTTLDANIAKIRRAV